MAENIDSARWLISHVLKGLWEVDEVLSFIGLFYIGKKAAGITLDILRGLRVHGWSKLVHRRYVPITGSWAIVAGGNRWVKEGYTRALTQMEVNVLILTKDVQEDHNMVERVIGVQTGSSILGALQVQILEFQGTNVEVRIIQIDEKNMLKMHYLDQYFNDLNITTLVWCPEDVTQYHTDNSWMWASESVAVLNAVVDLFLFRPVFDRESGAIVLVCPQSHTKSCLFERFWFLPCDCPFIHTAMNNFTKAYAKNLGNYFNVNHTNITVQAVTPFYVSHPNVNSRIIPVLSHYFHDMCCLSAEKFATSSLTTLGHTKCTSGHWFHGVMNWFVEQAPKCMKLVIYLSICRYMLRQN